MDHLRCPYQSEFLVKRNEAFNCKHNKFYCTNFQHKFLRDGLLKCFKVITNVSSVSFLTKERLEERITENLETVTQDVLQGVWQKLEHILDVCCIRSRANIEHICNKFCIFPNDRLAGFFLEEWNFLCLQLNLLSWSSLSTNYSLRCGHLKFFEKHHVQQ